MASSDYTSLRSFMQLQSNNDGKPKRFNVPMNSSCSNNNNCVGTVGVPGPTGPTGKIGPSLFNFNQLTNSGATIMYPSGNSIVKIADGNQPDIIVTSESYTNSYLSFSVGSVYTLSTVGITFDSGVSCFFAFNFDQYGNLYVKYNGTQQQVETAGNINTTSVYAIYLTSTIVEFYKNNVLLINTVIRSDQNISGKAYFSLDTINATIKNISFYTVYTAYLNV